MSTELIFYLYTAFMWACFAVKMDNTFNPQAKSTSRNLTVFGINLLMCPISITIAFLNMYAGSYDNHFKKRKVKER